MPYITEPKRLQFKPIVKSFEQNVNKSATAGDLNYLVTKLILRYLEVHELSYATINDIRGSLENAASEFYRRIAAPYEDVKIKQNGDVF